MARTVETPLFPLGTVLFPGAPLPLRIFEPRYLDMVSGCLRNDRPFGVCLIRSGSETGAPAEPYPVGTLARIVDWNRDDRGLLTITAVGQERFRTLETRAAPDRLLLGRCEPLAEREEQVPYEHEPLAQLARDFLERFGWGAHRPPPPAGEASWSDAAWAGYRVAEILPIPAVRAQHLLELDDPLARLRELDRIVALMAEAARVQEEGGDPDPE